MRLKRHSIQEYMHVSMPPQSSRSYYPSLSRRPLLPRRSHHLPSARSSLSSSPQTSSAKCFCPKYILVSSLCTHYKCTLHPYYSRPTGLVFVGAVSASHHLPFSPIRLHTQDGQPAAYQ